MTICRAKQATAAGNGWVYGYYVRMTAEDGREPLHLIYTGKRLAGREEDPSTPEWHRVSPGTVGRSTGVTDINGREVYEGDIVRYRWTDERYKKNPRYKTDVVEWDECIAGWGLRETFKPYFSGNRLEVIGNIHDNPELVERNDNS